MAVEEGRMPLANVVIKEFKEMEEKRRENQYNEVLQAFRRNVKEGTGFAMYHNTILYDEVRQKLEKAGFNVSVITTNSSGRAAYYITVNDKRVIEKSSIGIGERGE